MLMSSGKITVEVSEKIKTHLHCLPRTRRAETRSFKLIRNFSIRWICTNAIQSVFIQILHLSINQQTASMNLSLNAFRWIVISLHFFLLLSCLTLFHQWSVLNQVPQGGASLTVCCKRTKWIPGCGAWGQTGSISSDSIKNSHASWVQVFLLHKLQSSSSTLLWAFSKH